MFLIFYLLAIGIALSGSIIYELIPLYLQTMYLVLVERSGAEEGLSSVEIMFYNSVLSLPFLMFLIIATGEFPNSISILFAKVAIKPYQYIYVVTFSFGRFEFRYISTFISNNALLISFW